jgi:hypothetical protein
MAHKFVCRGTIEERIDELIEGKKSLSADLLDGGGERLLTEMNNEELLRFVALDLRRAVDACRRMWDLAINYATLLSLRKSAVAAALCRRIPKTVAALR